MNIETTKQYPVMPLKNTVLFPQQVIPIYVGREKSLKLIEDLPDDNKYLVVVAQQDGSIEDPKEDDLYSYGTLALVLKTFDMPDNSKSAIVQGVDRVKILKFNKGESYFMADIERIHESITTPDVQIEALAKNLKNSFTELIKISPNLNEEHAGMLSNIDRPSRLADRATSLLSVSNSEKQQVLEELDVRKRVENAINLLQKEIQRIKLVEEIEKLEGEYETKVNEKVEETKSEIVEKVDAYLNYVVEEWMKENELAIEKGLRAEITEDFIGGLKSLFESHYINVPQEKYDVIEAQTAEIEKLKEEVNQTIEKNVELNQAIGQHVRTDIINDVSSDLAETESEKLKGLAESIEYKDADSFRTSVETLKNSYFPKAKASETESNEVAENNAGSMNESMAAYTAAISKSKKNPYVK